MSCTYWVLAALVCLGVLTWQIKFFDFCSTLNMADVPKIIAFDLDETLGCFVELGMFWDALEMIYGGELGQLHFNEVMDLFPGFLRPNILNILDYIVQHKEQGNLHQVVIYTNNQGPKSWVTKISHYIAYRLNVPVFDQIVAAYKINGQQIERHRTTHDKTVPDLLRCIGFPSHTHICFVDDLVHPHMQTRNVFYINNKAYTYSLPFEEMAQRYYAHYHHLIQRISPMPEQQFVQEVKELMRRYNYRVTHKSAEAKAVDEQVGQQIMRYIQQFLDDKGPETPPRSTTQVGGGSRMKRKRRTTRRKRHLF